MEHRKGNPLYKTACTHQNARKEPSAQDGLLTSEVEATKQPCIPRCSTHLASQSLLLAHAAVVARCGCKSQKSGNMQHCTCKGQQRARSETKLGCTRWQKSRQEFGMLLLRARGGSERSHGHRIKQRRAPPVTTTTIPPTCGTLSAPSPGTQGASSGRCVLTASLACRLASPTSSS